MEFCHETWTPTSSKRRRRLLDAYRFAGVRPLEQVRGVFGDPLARVVTLVRRSKKRPAACAGACNRAGTTAERDGGATCHVGRIGSIWSSRCGGGGGRRARRGYAGPATDRHR